MPYLFTDEQQQISREARRQLSETYASDRLKALLEREGRWDEGFWDTCREMGWTGVTISEDHGGLGLGAVELGLIALECGRVVCGAPWLATGFGLGEALRLWGDADAQARFLPGLAAGELKAAIALNPGDVRLDGGRLRGTVPWAIGGAGADVVLVAVGDDLVVADLRDGNVERTVHRTFDNSRGSADLVFDGAPALPLPAGDPEAIRARLAVITAFEQLGGAETCLELARDYAMQRWAFGQPIGKFQGIKHKIAEMYVSNELARGTALRAALSLDASAPELALHAAAARLNAIAAYEWAASEAIQVHGAVGVTWEHDLHLHYRRSRALAVELGSSAQWEDRIALALGLARTNEAA